MQRSRKALLRRTAAAQVQSAVAEAAGNGRKRRLYGFSVSLVVTLWVAVLLLHSLVGHGDGQRGITVCLPSSALFRCISPRPFLNPS